MCKIVCKICVAMWFGQGFIVGIFRHCYVARVSTLCKIKIMRVQIFIWLGKRVEWRNLNLNSHDGWICVLSLTSSFCQSAFLAVSLSLSLSLFFGGVVFGGIQKFWFQGYNHRGKMNHFGHLRSKIFETLLNYSFMGADLPFDSATELELVKKSETSHDD